MNRQPEMEFVPGSAQAQDGSPSYTWAMGQLVEVVQRLSMARELGTVMEIVRHAARELTGADGATFVLREGDQCFYAEENAISPLWKGRRFPMSICISGWVMLNRQSTVIEDIYTDDRIPAEAYLPTFVKSLAMVPIRTHDPVGAIGNYWAKPYRPNAEQLKILQALADTTAVALENIRIYAELNQKVRDMAALMRATPVAIVSFDADGKPTTWNETAERLFGNDVGRAFDGEMPGLTPGCKEAFFALLNRVRSGLSVNGDSIKGRRPNGAVIDLRVSGAPVKSEDGTLRATLVVLEDETERNNLERQFLHAQKMEAVGQLTGGIAHDFNNLLGILIGNLDLVRDRIRDDTETAQMIDTALEAGLKGAELNKRLLAFSRRQALQPEEVAVNSAISSMVALLRRSLGERIRIRLDCGEELWPVIVDPVQLETALVNLCINSRDAMPAGGVLTVETRNTTLDGDYASAHTELSPGDYVMIAISDTGTGMKPAVLARAFDPFFTTKPVGQGTGLGLSMVYGFLKQSGGHVNLYSELHKGTTVRLYLPRQAATSEGAAVRKSISATPRSLNQELILVVEDNADVRHVAALQLRGLGYRVELAEDAERALAAVIGGLRPSLVLADVVMPGMGGIELADRLRSLHPDLPVLLSSGFTERAVLEAQKMVGNSTTYRLLPKPYRKADLAQALRAIFENDGPGHLS